MSRSRIPYRQTVASIIVDARPRSFTVADLADEIARRFPAEFAELGDEYVRKTIRETCRTLALDGLIQSGTVAGVNVFAAGPVQPELDLSKPRTVQDRIVAELERRSPAIVPRASLVSALDVTERQISTAVRRLWTAGRIKVVAEGFYTVPDAPPAPPVDTASPVEPIVPEKTHGVTTTNTAPIRTQFVHLPTMALPPPPRGLPADLIKAIGRIEVLVEDSGNDRAIAAFDLIVERLVSR